jgi:hypothetical protein
LGSEESEVVGRLLESVDGLAGIERSILKSLSGGTDGYSPTGSPSEGEMASFSVAFPRFAGAMGSGLSEHVELMQRLLDERPREAEVKGRLRPNFLGALNGELPERGPVAEAAYSGTAVAEAAFCETRPGMQIPRGNLSNPALNYGGIYED